MKTTPIALAWAATLLGGLMPAAQAGVVLQPAAAFTNMGTFAGSPDLTRNQSGLNPGYTSLVTDFDTYIASNPIHNGGGGEGPPLALWLSPTATGNFDFDLGGTFTIESFAFWNLGGNSNLNLQSFELLADDNAAFGSPTSLGTFTATNNTGPTNVVPVNVFTFTPTPAAFVRMNIISNYGSNTSGFGEAAFEVVPEPSSLVTVVLALSLIGWPRR